MQSYYIKPKAFYDSFGDVQPSQPYNYSYGDRPVFEFSFLPNEIAEGDTLVFAIDNDMVFYDSTPENLFHSASCMVVCKHDVTAEEATAGKVQMRIETRTVKFRDVTNGKVRPVEVVSGLYRKRGSDDDINYVLLAKGRAMANGIIADYDALPEPITTDEYYTKDEIDGLLDEKADEDDFTAHTGDTDIHVTLQDKTAWDSKADLNDIGTATITITQGGTSKGAFSVNASENVTIEVNDGAQADWNETDTSSPSFIQHKPTIYTQSETDALLDLKADKATTYTKTEIDQKMSVVYKYCGTVSTYADLPSSGQNVGDVYNVETADTTHGIKAGDNVAWNGTTWDVLAGTVDLSGYLEKPATAGTTGQVLTVTASGSAWQDVPTEIPAGGSTGQVLTKTASAYDWENLPEETPDALDYFCITASQENSTVSLNKAGSPDPIDLEYSLDKKTWTAYTWEGSSGATITLANAGDKVWLRGNNSVFSSSNGQYKFSLSKQPFVSGNIMSLVDKTCISLTIPSNYCFKYLFHNQSISSMPKLPALNLTEGCYSYMFNSAIKYQTKAPELPARNMAIRCYEGMFADSYITEMDFSNVLYLAPYCFSRILTSGIYFSRMKVAFTSWGNASNHYTDDWFSTASGVFECPASLDCTTRDGSHVPAGWTIVRTDAPQSDWSTTDTTEASFIKNKPDIIEAPAVAGTVGQVLTKTATGQEWADPAGGEDTNDYLQLTAAQANSTVRLDKSGDGSGPDAITLEYSTDKSTWNDYEWSSNTGTTITLSNINDSVWFRGNNSVFSKGHGGYYKFVLGGKIKAYGTIMSLIDKTCEKKDVPLPSTNEGFFHSLFRDCTALITPPKLTATTLTKQGYAYMFKGCTSLETAPELPATSVPNEGYMYMFNGCTSLRSTPKLPAVNLEGSAYSSMFSSCTSLVNCENLPAKTAYYYAMFSGCSSLTKAPVILATNGSCKSMFSFCTSLVEAPSLSTFTSGQFGNMFQGCTALKKAPDLSGISLGYITFQGTFKNCTSLKIAPRLSQTTNGKECYSEMFEGCTNLEIVPLIAGTNQVDRCYKEMFKNCTSLKYVKTNQTSFDQCTNWLNGASSVCYFDCPSTLDTTTRDADHIPSGWIVTHGANEPDDGTTSVVEALTPDVYTVCPSSKETGVLTVSSALTLNAYPASSTDIAYCEVVLDIASNATVTAGTGLTFVDTPEVGKRNICVVRWSGGTAKLYVTIVEDLPQA